MRKTMGLHAASVLAVMTLVAPAATAHDVQQGAETPPYGQMMGPMGPGMMGQGGMGPMHGMGRGMMGGGAGMRVTPSRDLEAEDVRHHFRHHLEWMGNERLKVGEVKQADEDTITADIVTVVDSLVQRFQVNRRTGWVSVAE